MQQQRWFAYSLVVECKVWWCSKSQCRSWKFLLSVKVNSRTTTEEQEHILKDRLASLKKRSLSLEEYQRWFKQFCDILAAIDAHVSDIDKVFAFARGLGVDYKEFRIAMLAKPHFPSFNQFLLSLQSRNQFLKTEAEAN